jgi:hypothetical protein
MSADDTGTTDAERLAYLERVERAARDYVDLIDQPSEGPGFMVVHRIEDTLRALTLAVRQGVGP